MEIPRCRIILSCSRSLCRDTQVDFSSSRFQEQKSIPCRSIEWAPFFAILSLTLQFIYLSLFWGEQIWLIVLCFIFTDLIKRWRWYRIDYYIIWSKMDFILKLGWAFSVGKLKGLKICGRRLLFGGDLSTRERRQMLSDGKVITSRLAASMRTGTAATCRYIKWDAERSGGQM